MAQRDDSDAPCCSKCGTAMPAKCVHAVNVTAAVEEMNRSAGYSLMATCPSCGALHEAQVLIDEFGLVN